MDTRSSSGDELPGLHCGGGAGPWSGPQLYYVVSLEGGTRYDVTARVVGGWDAALVAFPASTPCTEAAIEAACADHWSDAIGDKEESLRLRPTASEDWILAVDAWCSKADGCTDTNRGELDLEVSFTSGPAHSTCAAAQPIALDASGAATIEGTTSGAVNEFAFVNCGGNPNGPWAGGQVYYRVTLPPARSYDVQLTSMAADLAAYAFPASSGCSEAGINAGCTSPVPFDPGRVLHGDLEPAWTDLRDTQHLSITTGATGEDWIIAVDGYSEDEAGAFSLSLRPYQPPGNGTCAQAAPLAVGQTVRSHTLGVANEFAGIVCGYPGEAWDSGQAYFRVSLDARAYEASVDADFDVALYAFPASTSCDAAAVEAGCSDPATEDPYNYHSADESPGSGNEGIWLRPAAPGDWIFVVDSRADPAGGGFGTFDLRVFPLPEAPTNATCAAAAPVQLAASPTTVTGSTRHPGAPDEFPEGIGCGDADYAAHGPQLYYRVPLEAGRTYQVTLHEDGWDGALYAFPAAVGCTAAAINQACEPYASDEPGRVDEVIEITPAERGDWIIAVDSFDLVPLAAGAFSLEIRWE